MGEGPTRQVCVRFPLEDYERMRDIARRNRETVSELVRRWTRDRQTVLEGT